MLLFDDKKNCCGCGACLNACSKNAIAMQEDSYGYVYPVIDDSLCVECGRCRQVCAFQNKDETNNPVAVYAAAAKNSDIIQNSSSGGIFTALAGYIIENGGVVFGAAFGKDWYVKHIAVEDKEQLKLLRGSKYTQSSTGTTFKQVKELLKDGRYVLYSGTPCQIAGLHGFLGKEYDNLLTVDLVCHGVPNNRMFRDYIKQLEKNENGRVLKYSFRDKSIGWGKNGSAVIEASDGKRYKKKLWESASSYPYFFAKSLISRENCSSCKYACAHRPGDITLGDYWGIEKAHPEYLGSGGFDDTKGISAVVANSDKGNSILQDLHDSVELKASSFESASAGNERLRHGSECSPKRSELLELYKNGGWAAVDKYHSESLGLKKHLSFAKSLIPPALKRYLKGR
ncbi:MAG: Coenzyme F420 hydrogenase/dehydrogenase, beta subunit C-terminal domain [Ruminococcus sp.]|nr:Coenzyme F420 hydrogenase/dehydrogenase, beta subunit C-terminal domain [Ruminococcus sp.]